MPKMKTKTHRGAAKRFKVSGSGKFIKSHAFRSHKFEKKSTNRKLRLNQPETASNNDAKRISAMLPYSK